MIRKLALMTTFWGQRFTDFFDRYCIPSLLTADNLPRLAAAGTHVTILLYTEQATFEALKQSPRFERLTRVAEVRPIFFDSFRAAGNPSHWEPWHHAAVTFADAFDAFVLLITDCVYVKDAFSRAATALETADVIYFPTPEVCLETVTRRFDACFIADGALELDGLAMANVVLDFMHPKHAVGDFRGRFLVTHPEFFVAARKDRLALSHVASHAMGFRSDIPGLSYTFNPLADGLRTAFLDILGVGCEPTLKYYEQYLHWPRLTLDSSRLVNLASWASGAREPGNSVYADTEAVIELRDGRAVAQYRAPRAHPRARLANRLLDQVANVFLLYAAATHECVESVRQCIALAACLPTVRRRLKRLGPDVTVLLPVGGQDRITPVLRAIEQSPRPQATMAEFLLLHVVPGHQRLRQDQHFTLERVVDGSTTRIKILDPALKPSMGHAVVGRLASEARQLTPQQRVFHADLDYGALDRLIDRLGRPATAS